jgi:hypothetical protein
MKANGGRQLLALLGLSALLTAGCGGGTSAQATPVNGNKAICSALAAWNQSDVGLKFPPPKAAYRRENQLLMQRLEADGPLAKDKALAAAAIDEAKDLAAGRERAATGWANAMGAICVVHLGYPIAPRTKGP